ncbi:MAG: hypothetical protein ABSH48_12650 [Verrucomicrobiota bacterium]|jgi:hypothetical protein
MKKTTMVLLVAGGLAFQAVAADPASSPSAQTPSKVQAKTALSIFKIAHSQTVPSDKIERLGNISSRPWAQIAGQPAPPLFEDQREYLGQPNFNLFWVGASPH